MISKHWEQIRPSSTESDETVVPESLENRLKKLQENLRNQETVISQLKTVNETIQIEVTGIVKDLQVQKARNDELEKRYNASVKRECFYNIRPNLRHF